MKPIGLRTKHDGELMIVHECLSCGKISNNRIAGDDIPDTILTLIVEKNDGRNFLTKEDRSIVYEALFGKNVQR